MHLARLPLSGAEGKQTFLTRSVKGAKNIFMSYKLHFARFPKMYFEHRNFF